MATLLSAQEANRVVGSEQAFARGVELQQHGDLDGARKAYEESLQMVPRRADALSNLGVIFAHLGDYSSAIDNYKKAVEIDPHLYEVRLNLGIAYYEIQDFESAILLREIRKRLGVLPMRSFRSLIQPSPTLFLDHCALRAKSSPMLSRILASL